MGDLGFSGLRILQAASDQGFQDVAIFQGASFYRSRARGQHFGVTARGLSIRTGDEPGEEFPLFREFWIEKPAPASNTLTMHALLDSASVTGAFRFTHPSARDDDHRHRNDPDRPRRDRQVRHRRDGGELSSSARSTIAEPTTGAPRSTRSTGLQILSGKGEWLWRPVPTARRCRSPPSPTHNPRGFGLVAALAQLRRLLRRRGPLGIAADAVDRADRRLGRRRPAPARNPRDLRDQRQYRRPVAAEGRHCRGATPVASPTASSGAGRRRSQPPLATCTSSRGGQDRRRCRRFAVEMAGDVFADAQKAAAANADIHANPGKIVSTRALPLQGPADRVRVLFDLDPGSETYSEIRLTLNLDNQPASETWLFRWTA